MFAAQKNRGKQFYWLLLTGFSLTIGAVGQGTFIYDQQSAVEGTLGEGGGAIQSSQPFGQSFTPSLSSINFIRLWLADAFPGNSLGASVYINLRSNSITGPIMASTDPVFMADGFGVANREYANFFFSTEIAVTPGMTYFFQPVVGAGGDTWVAGGDTRYNYTGGTLIFQGVAKPFSDLWFREGILVVPEPSSLALLLLGSGVLFYVRRAKHRR